MKPTSFPSDSIGVRVCACISINVGLWYEPTCKSLAAWFCWLLQRQHLHFNHIIQSFMIRMNCFMGLLSRFHMAFLFRSGIWLFSFASNNKISILKAHNEMDHAQASIALNTP
jgi:hypothetical protein